MDGERSTRTGDAELIVGSVDEPALFGEVFDRHVDAVLAFFYRRTGCAQVAADLMAETFAAGFSSRRRFRDTGVPARAWLFKIARRQLARYVRREEVGTRARRRLGVDLSVQLSQRDMERIEAIVDFAPVEAALGALPEGQAEAVWLRVGHDLSYAEVASRLGCSEGAARVRVSRGLSRMAVAMEGQCHG